VAGLEDQTAFLRRVDAASGDRELGAAFLARSSVEVAPQLLGHVLVHDTPAGRVGVRLTEVEAYSGPGDPGSHARNGRTPRTGVMFGPAGHLYVYFSYGMHWCVNLVCEQDGTAAAVLLRAGEVVEGLPLARSRRTAARQDRDLARGPARLASALGLDRAADGLALGGAVRLLSGQPVPRSRIRSGPRVGVSGPGGDGDRYPWRFWVDGDPTVSVYRPGVSRRRTPRTAAD
jgi:DNA-3-methyladenine glycosylase